MADEDLVNVYVARRIDAPASGRSSQAPDASLSFCFDLRRVQWRAGRLSPDGQQLICRFRAPDAESVRQALRRAGIPFDRIWTEQG